MGTIFMPLLMVWLGLRALENFENFAYALRSVIEDHETINSVEDLSRNAKGVFYW